MYQLIATVYEQHGKYYVRTELRSGTTQPDELLDDASIHVDPSQLVDSDEASYILAVISVALSGIAANHDRVLF